MEAECKKLWNEMNRRFDNKLWHRPTSEIGKTLHNRVKKHLNLDFRSTNTSDFMWSIKIRYWGALYQTRFGSAINDRIW